MAATKFTKAEALRKSIDLSRVDAFNALSSEDKETYEDLLLGDAKAVKKVQLATLSTPLYDAGNYVVADHLDIIDAIKRLDLPEASSLQLATATPGAPFPGLPGLPSLPGFGAPATAPAAPASGAAPSKSSLVEVTELLDAWKTRYGDVKGIFEEAIISNALAVGDKELIVELMDREIFRLDSMKEVKTREEGKTYLTRDSYDIKKVPLYEYLLTMNTTSLYEVLTEHPVGIDMFKQAASGLQYHALQFAFDTKNRTLLEGFLDTKIDITSLRDPTHNTPLICDFMYRAEEDDAENLQLLVEHGASLTDLDPLHSGPLMVAARIGNLDAMKWLLQYDVHDLYAKNLMGDTVLSIVEAGPEKRREDQEGYDSSVERAKERFVEKHQAWEVQARSAEAAGKKPPEEPKEPQFKPRPVDYPSELVQLIQDAWTMGDPSTSKQALALEKLHEPDEYAMDFESSF